MRLLDLFMLIFIMVDKIISSGANVAICQKGIDDVAQHYLAKSNILAVRRVKESDMTKLSRATGARIVNNLEDLSSKDLGSSDLVEERKVETDKWVFIEGCKNPKAVTILIRGGSQRVVDEAERAIHDALMVTKDVMEKPAIVAGGGSPESYVAGKLREWSSTLSGREQLAADKFAESLEVIPLALAENAGMDPIDTLTELRSKQAKGSKWSGIDARSAKIVDMSKLDIVEPLSVKEQIIKSATEVASMLQPGEEREITISLPADAFRYWDEDKAAWASGGSYDVMLGSSSRDIVWHESIEVPAG